MPKSGELTPDALFQRAPIGLVHTTHGGDIIRANTQFANQLGLAPEDVDGKLNFRRVMPREDHLKYSSALRRALAGHQVRFSSVVRFRDTEGQAVPYILETSTVDGTTLSDLSPLLHAALPIIHDERLQGEVHQVLEALRRPSQTTHNSAAA